MEAVNTLDYVIKEAEANIFYQTKWPIGGL